MDLFIINGLQLYPPLRYVASLEWFGTSLSQLCLSRCFKVKWGVIWLWLCIILERVIERGEKEEILEEEGDERVKSVPGQMEEWGV